MQFTYGGGFGGKRIKLILQEARTNSEYGMSSCGRTGETQGNTRTGEPGFEYGVPEYLVTTDDHTNTNCTFESFHPIMQACRHYRVSRAKIDITLLLIVLSVAALPTSLSLDLVEVCVMPGLRVRYPDSPVCVCKIELGTPLALESDYCIRTPLDIGGL